MGDEKLFEKRITLLGLERTLAPDATIRDTRGVDQTAVASSAELPHISFEVDRREALGAARTSDLAIVSTIGEGGMGRVHLARQRSLDRDVAVKTLKDDASPAASAGLFREARLTGSLEHPGVIPVHALGVDEKGGPLLVMKRVEGVDWGTLLEAPDHPLWALLTANVDRLAANLEILTQVARTVEFAHSRGIIHRDIKPENVMVGSYGEVYLVDWGIATPAKAQRLEEGLVGTPAFMAPEMFLGEPVDERTDVYLLGATLHQVLTGSFRHDGTELMHVLQSALLSKPVAYTEMVPDYLASLCNAATSRSPEDRPQSAREFRDQLAEFLHRRSAMALASAAQGRLDALTALLASAPEGGAPSDLVAAYRLANEARFGFTQSLREHPESATAQQGLVGSVTALVELELRQAHADTAEALLRELGTIEPGLLARVEEVRRSDEQRRREAQRLQALDRDLDPTVEATPRAVGLGLLVLMSGTLSAIAFLTSGELTARHVLLYGVVFAGAVGVGILLFRKQLFSNSYNAKLTGILIAGSVLVVLQRLVAYAHDETPAQIFATDLWIEAMTLAAGAVALQRRLWLAVPPMVIAATLIPSYPRLGPGMFTLSTMISFALIGVALWPRATRKKP